KTPGNFSLGVPKHPLNETHTSSADGSAAEKSSTQQELDHLAEELAPTPAEEWRVSWSNRLLLGCTICGGVVGLIHCYKTYIALTKGIWALVTALLSATLVVVVFLLL